MTVISGVVGEENLLGHREIERESLTALGERREREFVQERR